MSARHLLQHGIRRRVGDGNNISIWEDRWLGDNSTGKVTTPKPCECEFSKVSQLIHNFSWNKPLVKSLFNEADARNILKIPISFNRKADWFYWKFDASGIYTVKSGYREVKRLEDGAPDDPSRVGEGSSDNQKEKCWNFLWKINMKQKNKMFIWKCLNRILPVNELLFRKIDKGNPICCRCGDAEETLEHLFFFCQEAALCWKLAPIKWDGFSDERQNFWRWRRALIKAKERKERGKHISLTCYILWHIWKARNSWQFRKETVPSYQVIQRAVEEWREFETFQEAQGEQNRDEALEPNEGTSTPSSNDTIIILPAATIKHQRGRVGYGIIATDKSGKAIAAWALRDVKHSDKHTAEAEAIRFALIKAKAAEWDRIEIHGSCSHILNKISTKNMNNVNAEVLLEDISPLGLWFSSCSFKLVSKDSTKISYRLAKFAEELIHDVEWKGNFPSWIIQNP